MESSKTPNIKWAQRKDRIYITVDALNIKHPQIDIVDSKHLKFSGKGDGINYGFELTFFDEVSKEDSKYTLDTRNIFLSIKKKAKGPYWPRLMETTQKYQWLTPDWNLYVEEDEEEEDNKPKFGGNEMSKIS
jgi:prostaglandin-E synthase